jgi:nucleotide-binding universal stress UspA family protein
MENSKTGVNSINLLDHILVPLDGSRIAECVLPHAVALAHTFGARVTLLQVVAQAPFADQAQTVDPLRWHMRKTEAESYLDSVVARLREAELQVDKVTLEGEAANNVIEFAHEHRIDLILLSSHGQSGLSKWNVSSVVQKIILRANMPVMIVRAYQSTAENLLGLHYKRVLAPLDGSQRAEYILPLACNLAHFHDGQLLLAHAVRKPEMPRHTPLTEEEAALAAKIGEYNRREAEKYLGNLKERLKCDTQSHLLESADTAAALHDLIREKDVDLVALSAHGYTSTPRWPYGSMALNFIAYGTTPLLVMQDMSTEELEQTQAEQAAKESKGH